MMSRDRFWPLAICSRVISFLIMSQSSTTQSYCSLSMHAHLRPSRVSGGRSCLTGIMVTVETLTAQQKQYFDDQGYLLLHNVIPHELCDRVTAYMWAARNGTRAVNYTSAADGTRIRAWTSRGVIPRYWKAHTPAVCRSGSITASCTRLSRGTARAAWWRRSSGIRANCSCAWGSL